MKYFLCFLVLSLSAHSAPQIGIQRVNNIEVSDDVASISFSDIGEGFKVPENSGVMACLKNGWLAEQKVLIKYDDEKNSVQDCRLYSMGGTGFEAEKPMAQAQEEKKSKK